MSRHPRPVSPQASPCHFNRPFVISTEGRNLNLRDRPSNVSMTSANPPSHLNRHRSA
ncbi:MAG: hypothetical protein F6K42_38555 [Leptolyngbya sp. SIO1D8]|nr:hypothetical protein [Leptolyngbya sp. SIO1D8]